jgi:hypothetical protein
LKDEARIQGVGLKIACFMVAMALVLGMALASVSVFVASPGVDTSQPWGGHVIAPNVRVVRQTMTAERNGLTAISLRSATVSAKDRPDRWLTARIVPLQDSAPPIDVVIRVSGKQPAEWLLSFPPIPTSAGRRYSLELASQLPDAGLPELALTVDDWYPDGTLELDGEPLGGDLAFQTYYMSRPLDLLVAGISSFVSNSAKTALLALALFLLPGFIFDLLFGLRLLITVGPGPAVAVWMALSVGLLELRGMAMSRHLSGVSALVLLPVMLGIVILRLYPRPRRQLAPIADDDQDRQNIRGSWMEFCILAVLFVVMLLTRCTQITGITFPAWVDGVEHAQRVSTILSPSSSLGPYYHYGFHFIVADLIRLTNTSIPAGILVTGQVISMLVPLVVYGWARHLGLRPLEAWVASLATGLVSVMPSYYIAWGRYPLLLGWLTFPGATIMGGRALDPSRKSFSLVWAAGASVAVIGALIAHSRMAAYIFLFILGVMAHEYLMGRIAVRRLGELALVGILTSAVTLWWILGFAAPDTNNFGQAQRALSACRDSVGLIGRIKQVTPDRVCLALLMLGLVGLVVGTIWRRPPALVTVTWTLFLLIAANLPPRIPGCGFITNYTLAIGLFLPVSIGAGLLVGIATGALSKRVLKSYPVELAALARLLLLAVAWIAGFRLLSIPDATVVFERSADREAMSWVRENVPVDAIFMINTFEWMRNQFQPSDAGGWLPFVLDRMVALEASKAIGQTLKQGKGGVELICHTARAAGVTHLYLGRRGGIISPKVIESDASCFERIYEHAGVRIYRVTAE